METATAETKQETTDKKEVEEPRLPIAEIFTSPQGEGLWAGTLMTFIRLAGCTVGRPLTSSERAMVHPYPPIPDYIEMCHTYDNRAFLCDTNFRLSRRMTFKEIINESPAGVAHICITGGEPVMHSELSELICYLRLHRYTIHIETSGTISPHWLHSEMFRHVWVTVSPKLHYLPTMLQRANEIKLLVGDGFDDNIEIPSKNDPIVFLSPINGISTINSVNMQRCLEIQKKHPSWRITMQLHKVMGVR